ncbi:putative transcription factor C2H2 family [Helianthus annuus]|nr:putative transcription factor C2H2 family [Helianthus annuus]KAJ0601897.1 putative transcription factor C2H2 family [Helianthus annuus]KAJ0608887.1 putative transcription factor C2H2 family [Helianthus annuus]
MDGSCSKRGVSGISAPKKKPIAAVKDTAGARDGTGQLCNRIGCSGRVNHNNNKGTKNKALEKPKPLKPSVRSSSSKEIVTGSSSKKCLKPVDNSDKRVCSKIESSSGSNESGIRELNVSGTQTRKLKSKSVEVRKEDNSLRVQNGELNNGRKKRLTQGESSSSGSKGKKIIGVSTNEGRVSDSKNSRNTISSRTNGVSSVRTRKAVNLENSKGSNSQQSANDIANMPQTQELSLNGDQSTSDTSTDRSVVGFGNDNGTRHYSIDGITDVLLALNRFGQDEELTYEQLLSLEASLFFGGLNFFDQHRDMRLDIDNMSYEELLVLEEKMGTVSTALSEEELSKCIKTGIYECSLSEDGKMRRSACTDDNKCSICQEEFVRGDEVGRLGCGHGYHTPCINQWLGLKNWCPICKASPKPLSTDA